MSRYIYITDDCLMDIAYEHMDDNALFGLQNALEEIPTADVVEVVRCKDCKFRKIEFGWNGKKYKMCANTDYPTDDDAYCSYAERREAGNE